MPQTESVDRTFDGEAFYAALAATVTARGVTWKQVSHETGVSATTLTRMSQGRRPDAASLASLSAWATLNPAEFVGLQQAGRKPEPLAQITRLLRSDRRLKPDAAKALEVMIRTAYEQLRSASESDKPASPKRVR